MRSFVLLAILSAVFAQDDSLKVYRATADTIWAKKFVKSELLEFSSDGVAINRDEISSRHPVEFVDLLSAVGGVYCRRQRPIFGASATPMINGGSSNHQRVLVDGLPVQFPQLGLFDAGWLSMSAISRAEVIPGAWSSVYGTGGMAGAMNFVIEMDRFDTTVTDIEYMQGNYALECIKLRMEHNLFRGLSMLIAGDRVENSGYLEGEKNRVENVSSKFLIGASENFKIELFGHSHRGWLDYYSYGTLGHQRDEVALADARINARFGENLLTAAVRLEKYKQKYFTSYSSSEHKANVLTFDLRAAREFGAISTKVFVQPRLLKLRSTDSGDHDGLSELGAGIQSTVRSNWAKVLFSVRYDKGINGQGGFSFGGGLRKDLSKDVYAVANFGRGLRFPTPNDLWWMESYFPYSIPVIDSSGDTVDWQTVMIYGTRGNEELKKENSTNASVGIGFKKDWFEASFTAFATFYGDLIQWTSTYIPVPDGPDSSIWQPENIATASIAGLKIMASIKAFDWLSAGLNAAYLSAKDSTGKRLPERPDLFVTLPIKLNLSMPKDVGFNIILTPKYIGSFETTVCGTTEVIRPGFLVDVVLSATYSLFEIFVAWKNLTDTRWDTFDGRKSMGRVFYGGIRWRFYD